MFTKVTAVLLIASVALAAHVSFSENFGAKIDDDLVKLENAVNATFKEAGREIVEALVAFNRTAHGAANATASALNRMEEDIQKDLDALKAKAVNVSIDECLGQDEKTLLNLTRAFEIEDIRCVRGHERRVFEKVNATFVLKFFETRRIVVDIKREIEVCAKREECLQIVDQKIERETYEIPLRVEREAKQISKDIETVQTDELKLCGIETLQKAGIKSIALLTKISICVNGKLNN